MKKSFLFAVSAISLVMLTACAPPITRQQQLDIWYQRCLEYGFHPNTNGIAQCVQQQEIEREKALTQPNRMMFCTGGGYGHGGFATCF
ncbi:MAG TPA: hypothetical protein PKW15_07275 [Alphaproteobacteria bacterium]|nr:hypothetical protein [Rhodospirillaceae bacterium]HRJ13026.1 hypothetical protein [Alphaproteobacteria bacterium]